MTDKLMVDVYTSVKKTGAYLYVARGKGTSKVPDALKAQLGQLKLAMPLLLTPQKKLAKMAAIDVIEKIASDGYYLQYSPEQLDDYMRQIPNAKLPKS